MNITVNGRKVDITPTLKKYAEDKIGKFDKYLTNITEATVTLSVQKHLHRAEVQIRANGHHLQAEAITEELYSSIDEVVEKLDRQVKKLKDKLAGKRKGGDREVQAAPTIEDEPMPTDEKMIIESEQQFVKPMPPEEAASRLDSESLDFFVFTNSESGKFSVIYKRKDGNFGLIEAAGK